MRTDFLAAAMLMLLLCAGCDNEGNPSSAYPNRPIKIVVPFAAGGGTDAFARIIKQAIEENNLLPQPLVIVNVGGASGTIGSRRVKDARPDGYTVLLLHDAIVMAKYSGKVPYGPRDFQAVAGTSQNGTVVVMSEDSKRDWMDLKDAVNDAEANPDTVTFGCNLGTPTHYVGLLLERERPGAAFRFVQSGDGAKRFHDLKGGHIDLTVFSNEEYLRYKEDGVRALAFFSRQRHPLMPDVPTAIEQGFDAEAGIMQYWWMPKGTPPERVDVFADALEKAMQTDEIRQWLAKVQSEPTFARGEALQDRIVRLEEQVGTVNLSEPVDVPDLPLLTLCAVILLSAVVGVRSLRRAARTTAPTQVREAPRSRLALVCGAVVVLYVLALAVDINGKSVGYQAATLVFVVGMGAMLAKDRRRAMPWIIGLALVLSLGLSYLLTQVFVIDLP